MLGNVNGLYRLKRPAFFYNYFMFVRPAQDWEVDFCQFLLGVVFSLCKNREVRYVLKVEQDWLF